MAINFPTSPTTNDIWTENDRSWKFNGTSWDGLPIPSGSGIITYTPAGTGAVDTTVETKLREIVSVKDFGAVGDGVADDSGAIQAAINAAEVVKGTCFFPRGIYMVGTELLLKPYVTVIGASRDAAVLKAANSLNGTILIGDTRDQIGIRNLGFDGNSVNQTAGNLVIITDSSNFIVDGCRFNDSYNESLIVRECVQGSITNNIVNNSGADGISLAKTTSNGRDISLVSNVIINPTDSGINVSGQSLATVTGNSIQHTGSPSAHTTGFGGVRLTNGSESCTVTGNTVNGMSRGLFIASTAAAGNILTGNVVKDCGQQGILVEATSQIISSNVINDVGRVTTPSSGIQVSAAADDLQISGNSITGGTDMDIGIELSTTGDSSVVTSNRISGNTGVAISNSGGGANLFRDNQFAGRDIASGESLIASASTITLPPDGEIFNITGTTNIDTVAGMWAGRTVKLRFAGILTVNDSSGLRLAGNFVTAGSSILTLTALATTVYEVSRSTN